MTNIASAFHRTKNQVRRRTFYLKNHLTDETKHTYFIAIYTINYGVLNYILEIIVFLHKKDTLQKKIEKRHLSWSQSIL